MRGHATQQRSGGREHPRVRRLLAGTIGCLAIAIPLGACDGDDEPTEPTSGLANPASVFCVEQGGEVEIVDEAGGQVGYCNLPNGDRIEEWAYYRANSPDAVTTTAP